ncbi:DUF2147 domain-containing protein [Polaribacter sp. MSW13]|uniref:DUF2147 domain-containing protein n=1 Tax=Polaribacter marinus TaxID=2916838 RepID=A0A9X1VLI5_9FLAO|nr:DUF2147 domain-containing protein [Polaribacter marinus]MCI2228351.1 DUF2147 domain-containing protein [Polaribacter marinus]
MKKTFLFLVLSVLSVSINSQTIFGKWNSINEETEKIDSVIEVYEDNGKAYAKIIEITDKTKEKNLCELCKDENKNKPILGMNILTGLEKNGNEWSGGNILDPRSGKIYKCYIKLINKNKLKIRGYMGFSLFGKTAYWERSK